MILLALYPKNYGTSAPIRGVRGVEISNGVGVTSRTIRDEFPALRRSPVQESRAAVTTTMASLDKCHTNTELNWRSRNPP
jgi:hypothetical protein